VGIGRYCGRQGSETVIGRLAARRVDEKYLDDAAGTATNKLEGSDSAEIVSENAAARPAEGVQARFDIAGKVLRSVGSSDIRTSMPPQIDRSNSVLMRQISEKWIPAVG
jgi:hypothetical protein